MQLKTAIRKVNRDRKALNAIERPMNVRAGKTSLAIMP
jgi:hypothetical protein